MSLLAQDWAWRQAGLTPIAKFVLIALADDVSPDGECRIEFSYLRELTGVNQFGLQTVLAELERLGKIERASVGAPVIRIKCDRGEE